MKDLNFSNIHSLKHEILQKSRRVLFFRLQYFPYVSKGSKNGDDKHFSNYSPTSSSAFSKIFGKLPVKCIIALLESKKLLASNQHERINQHLTKNFLLYKKNLDQGNKVRLCRS